MGGEARIKWAAVEGYDGKRETKLVGGLDGNGSGIPGHILRLCQCADATGEDARGTGG